MSYLAIGKEAAFIHLRIKLLCTGIMFSPQTSVYFLKFFKNKLDTLFVGFRG
jgi:hypothetical protein